MSADVRDNDPAVLLTYIAVAMDRIERINPAVFRALASPAARCPRRLCWFAIAAIGQPVSLVLDHLEAITNRECLDAIAAARARPPAWIAARDRLADELAAPRQRAARPGRHRGDRRRRPGDGRHGRGGALLGAGVELADEDVRELVQRTEGWPVGLYLAAWR